MSWRRRRDLYRIASRLRPKHGEEWSIATILHHAEAYVDEDIRLVAAPPSAVTGLCGARTRVDGVNLLHIPSEEGSLGAHLTLDQELVAAHEISHVVCGHHAMSKRNARLLTQSLRAQWPGLPDSLVHLPADDGEADREESEAELLAALLLYQAQPPSEIGGSRVRYEEGRGREISLLFGGGRRLHGK